MQFEQDNIYGYLRPNNCLKLAKSVFKDRLGIPINNVSFQCNEKGNSLVVSSDKFHLYSGSILERGVQFGGFMSGSKEEIVKTLNEISIILKYVKIESEFEIYDENHNCIATVTSNS